MAITIADQYYLKAKDYYPYDLEQVIESLNYALSYETEHACANYLMGSLYMEHFQDYTTAEDYFQCALISEPHNVSVYENYIRLLIFLGNNQKALKLIRQAWGLIGFSKALLFYLEGMIHEYQKDYATAINFFKKAAMETFDSDAFDYYEREVGRVKNKLTNSLTFRYSMGE